ncbi:MAG: prepilin peptidase [Alphaproteobacteria bacterium]|nr:prepilin peptidase [Alphaproteobacteria bacterium]
MTDPFVFFDSTWARLGAGFILGSILGSFATMLAYRLPRRQSIVFPRSRCPSCGTALGVADLVPLLSWLFLKGRCRHCRAPIDRSYFLIELSASLLGALACLWLGFSWELLFAFLLIVATIVFVSVRLSKRRSDPL